MRPARVESVNASSAIVRSSADGARPSAYQYNRSTTCVALVCRGPGGNGVPGAGGTSRSISGSVPKIRNRPRIVSPCARADVFSSPATPRSRVNPRPETSYTSREGVLTRTPDANVASSRTTGPDATRSTDSSSGVRDVSGVMAPSDPTNSPRAHTASALSTAVELAFCTMSQSRDAPEISISNGAGAVRAWGGVPARPPRELIGVTKRAVGGAGNSPEHVSGAAKQPVRQPFSVDQLERLNRRRSRVARREDLVANRSAERARQRARGRLPFACIASGRRPGRDCPGHLRWSGGLIHVPVAGYGTDSVPELLGGQAPDFRPAEHISARLLSGSRHGSHLIRLRRHDRGHEPFRGRILHPRNRSRANRAMRDSTARHPSRRGVRRSRAPTGGATCD